MTQPSISPFRSATMAPAPFFSSAAMASAVSPKAPDSGTSLPRYCAKAAAMVAAIAGASAIVAGRRAGVSLIGFFSRRLAQKARGNADGPADDRSAQAYARHRRG